MHGLSGTLRLIRLALRRDRLKLPIWIIAIVGFAAIMPPALEETYGEQSAREVYYTTVGANVVGRMFGGIADDASLGSIMMVEAFAFFAVLVAVMNVLFVVRHTRQNEEMGSAELLQSARVGRYAPLTAVVVLAVGINIVLASFISLVFMQSEMLAVDGNILFGVATGGVGISTAALAAIGVQLFSNTRVTTVFLSLGVAVLFFLRAFGDGFAKSIDGKLESTWLSWLSPIGWGQQMYPYTRQDTWVVWLFVAATLLSLAVAYTLISYRDIGSGLLADRLGRSRASMLLRSIEGLTWRLQCGTLVVWVAVIMILGGVYGGMTSTLEDLAKDNPVIQQYVAALGGGDRLVEGFAASMIALMAMTILAYVAQGLGRLQSEETSGRLENVLAAATSRIRWAGGHALFTLVGSVILLVISTIAMGIVARLVSSESISWSIDEFVWAGFAYVPALALCWSVIIFVYAFWPRATSAFGWLLFVFVLSWYQFAALLKFPDWLRDISPFAHISLVPVESLAVQPILILIGLTVVVTLVAQWRLRSRDIRLT